MATTDDQGIRIPLGTSAADVVQFLKNAIVDVEKYLVRRYTSAADRTTRQAGQPAAPGAVSYLADSDLHQRVNSSGTQVPLVNPQMFGTTPAGLVGTPGSASAHQFLMQAGTFTFIADSSGNGSIPFTNSFPNGVLTLVVSNGDPGIDTSTTLFAAVGAGANAVTTAGFVCTVRRMSSGVLGVPVGVTFRVNYIAIGW